MLCQKCHKNLASVRYAEVVDGTVNDLHLCQDCLSKRQESGETGFELSEPAPFVSIGERSEDTTTMVSSTETCSSCSTDLSSIVETGAVGCSVCYDTFPAQLESLLEGIHVAIPHRGKVPQVDDARARVRTDLQAKRALLKTALGLENYEEAATLRDQIHSLELGLGASESGAD